MDYEVGQVSRTLEEGTRSKEMP